MGTLFRPLQRPLCRTISLALVLLCAALFSPLGQAQLIGVSWAGFTANERWKKDEAAIRAVLDANGAQYLPADAKGSASQQLIDIDSLLARGAKALIVVAQDPDALQPALRKAHDAGVPVIAYDRLIQDSKVLYVTFDSVEVGRMQARALLELRPTGNYVFIKGTPSDPNTDLVNAGQREVLRNAIQQEEIRIVGDEYTDNWSPEIARQHMERILQANRNGVDAVVVSNDGMAGGVIAALRAKNLVGTPVSGQDGDVTALNRVAKGEQTMTAWKDVRQLGKAAGEYAVRLANGASPATIKGVKLWTGVLKKTPVHVISLQPVAITRNELHLPIKAGWASKAQVCAGVAPDKVPACR